MVLCFFLEGGGGGTARKLPSHPTSLVGSSMVGTYKTDVCGLLHVMILGHSSIQQPFLRCFLPFCIPSDSYSFHFERIDIVEIALDRARGYSWMIDG